MKYELQPDENNFTIRKLYKKDINKIAEIYTFSWKRTYKNLLPDKFLDNMNVSHSIEKWHEYFKINNHDGFIAETENNIIGFCAYAPYEQLPECLILDSLHIVPSMQGKGLGTKLIESVIKYAKTNGYKKMVICIVNGNKKAEKLYKKMGAVKYKDFTDDFEGTPSSSQMLIWNTL